MEIKCAFKKSNGKRNINPTISKEEFESLGFNQYHFCKNSKEGGVWSVYYIKSINPRNSFDILDVKWFCGTQGYEIYRDTKGIKHIPCFCGFLRDKKDLELVLSLFDLTIFYEGDYPYYKKDIFGMGKPYK